MMYTTLKYMFHTETVNYLAESNILAPCIPSSIQNKGIF